MPTLTHSHSHLLDRAQRLKDARREALEEIEELKKRKNEELIEHEKKVNPSGLNYLIFACSMRLTWKQMSWITSQVWKWRLKHVPIKST